MDKNARICMIKYIIIVLLLPIIFFIVLKGYGLSFEVYLGNAYGYIWTICSSIVLITILNKRTFKKWIITIILFGFVIPIFLLFMFVTPYISIMEQPRFVAEVGYGVIFGACVSAGSIILDGLLKEKQ